MRALRSLLNIVVILAILSVASPALAARFETSAPTGDQDQFAGERGAVFSPSVAGDARFHRFFAGAELGARLRPVAELVGARGGSQLRAAAGARAAGVAVSMSSGLAPTLPMWGKVKAMICPA